MPFDNKTGKNQKGLIMLKKFTFGYKTGLIPVAK